MFSLEKRFRNASLFIKRHYGVLKLAVKLTTHGSSIRFHSGPSSVKGRAQHHLKLLGNLHLNGCPTAFLSRPFLLLQVTFAAAISQHLQMGILVEASS